MNSKREEERNEKVIRGLLKLPPNRRCINCNGMGPQYVCTNFWTFVCTPCSGIHREFTHRVKSVSMAKFTAQEVEALQNGGNQRAREIFLKDWDLQSTKLPDSSYPDRIREFIKNVYVEKKYATGRSLDKPPKDPDEHKSHEEHRRASSYHSFSQSPPYDNQYEDRRYGKQRIMLTRKPGSDHGHHEGNISSILYSPGRGQKHMFEDPFTNESSRSKIGNLSAVSTGDLFRPSVQSPSTRSEALTHRSVSLGSFGSLDDTSLCPKSANAVLSGGVLQPERQDFNRQQPNKPNIVSSETSISQNLAMIDLLSPQVSHQQDGKISVDLFLNFNNQPSCISPSENKPLSVPYPENKGWALFDTFHHVEPNAFAIKDDPSGAPQCSEKISDTFSSKQDSLKELSTLESVGHEQVPCTTDIWHTNFDGVQNAAKHSSTPVWNAFDDLFEKSSQATFVDSLSGSQYGDLTLPKQASNENGAQMPVSMDNGHKQMKNLSERTVSGSFPSEVSYTPDWKSKNPFDSAYDLDADAGSMFFDISSLQGALPNIQLPNSCLDSFTQPWFQQTSTSPFGPSIAQVGLPYVGGQVSSPQLQNVTSQGSGNPFA